MKEVFVPDIGDYQNVDVIDVLVNVGDEVKEEDSLITLETDKAAMDIPSPAAGKIAKVLVKVGDKISQGDLIIELEASDEAVKTPLADSSALQADAQAAEMPEPPAASPMAETTQSRIETILVPDIGSDDPVQIIEVMIQEGDLLDKDAPLVTLESDKASMEIPSPYAAKIKKVLVKVGDKISTGGAVAEVEIKGQGATSSPQPSHTEQTPKVDMAPPPPLSKSPAPVPVVSGEPVVAQTSVHAGPGVRRFAAELGVDLSQVKGTGRKGRLLKEDIQSFVKQRMSEPAALAGGGLGFDLPPPPKVDFSKFGEVQVEPLSRIKKLSGRFLHRNWVTIPHVTQFDEANITELEDFRKKQKLLAEKQGVKLTPLVFIMKAVVAGLKQFPTFNASLSENGEDLILKNYYHVGVAVDTPNGLVVPVIRDVDQKGMFQLAQELGEVSLRAREGKLTAQEMQGGCMSISSLGGIGGTAFTPIVNLPEVAILGVSRSQWKPVYQDGEFQPQLMLPLSLSYDHRVIDGADAARFTSYLVQQLSDIRRLLL